MEALLFPYFQNLEKEVHPLEQIFFKLTSIVEAGVTGLVRCGRHLFGGGRDRMKG